MDISDTTRHQIDNLVASTATLVIARIDMRKRACHFSNLTLKTSTCNSPQSLELYISHKRRSDCWRILTILSMSANFYCHSMLPLSAPPRDPPTVAGGGDALSVRDALVHTLYLKYGSFQSVTTVTFQLFYTFLVTTMPSFLATCHWFTSHAIKALPNSMSEY